MDIECLGSPTSWRNERRAEGCLYSLCLATTTTTTTTTTRRRRRRRRPKKKLTRGNRFDGFKMFQVLTSSRNLCQTSSSSSGCTKMYVEHDFNASQFSSAQKSFTLNKQHQQFCNTIHLIYKATIIIIIIIIIIHLSLYRYFQK